MAFLEIKNVRIAGIAACAPAHVEDNLTIPVFHEGEAERVIAQRTCIVVLRDVHHVIISQIIRLSGTNIIKIYEKQ